MFLPPTPNHLLPISGLPRIVPRARTGVSSTGAPKRYILGSDDIGFMASDGLGRAGGYSLLLSGISLQTSITADFSVRSRWPLPGTPSPPGRSCPKMRRPLLSLSFWVLPLAYVPAWWRKGWPRGRADSMAEAELLSELAALLMPRTEVGVLFRSFPATEGWGGHSLQPIWQPMGFLKIGMQRCFWNTTASGGMGKGKVLPWINERMLHSWLMRLRDRL